MDCFTSYLCWTVSNPTSVGLFHILPLLDCFKLYICWTCLTRIPLSDHFLPTFIRLQPMSPQFRLFPYRLSLALFNVTSVGLFPIPPLLDCVCLRGVHIPRHVVCSLPRLICAGNSYLIFDLGLLSVHLCCIILSATSAGLLPVPTLLEICLSQLCYSALSNVFLS